MVISALLQIWLLSSPPTIHMLPLQTYKLLYNTSLQPFLMAVQPNFSNIHNHLVGLIIEVDLIPNLPIAIQPQLLQNFQQLALQSTKTSWAQPVNPNYVSPVKFVIITCKCDSHQVLKNDLLSIQLYNASSSLSNPLQYPPGFAVVPPRPVPNGKAALYEPTGKCDWHFCVIKPDYM